jgi:hypothetical protein
VIVVALCLANVAVLLNSFLRIGMQIWFTNSFVFCGEATKPRSHAMRTWPSSKQAIYFLRYSFVIFSCYNVHLV